MELYKELLQGIFEKEQVQVVFPNLNFDLNRVLEMECYNALQEIKAIIHDDSLDDAYCYMKIEEIIYALDRRGIYCGFRHD